MLNYRQALWLMMVVFLMACAGVPTRRGFDQTFSQSIGEDINKMISALGPPQKTYNMPNGDMIYTFYKGQTYRTPVTTNANVQNYGYGYRSGQATTSGGDVVSSYCRIDFTVNSAQRIASYRAEGDQCKIVERR